MNQQITILPNRRHVDRGTSLITVTPLLDLVEREEGFVLYCDLPGAEGNEIELTFHKGILHIRAAVLLRHMPGKVHALEMGDTVYEARLRLTASVDTDRITATLSGGVLRVHLPFPVSSGMTRIPVIKG